MKKTIITIAIVLIILAAIALGLVWYFVWNDSGYIGRDAAEAAALSDAGLAASEVSRLRSSFERDDGLVFYEVSFVSGALEYEYVIDPVNASVLHVEAENAYD